ncbi:MAG: flagellar basal body P-ring protein FlgI [Rickettsiaceae bacterium]
MYKIVSNIIFIIFLVSSSSSLYAETRIKDIASVVNVRNNLLVGKGLVVGLKGTGDNLNNTVFTQKELTDFLERLGVNIQGANFKTKNVAAVTITAALPPFAKQGTTINVTASSIGDATSLKGGVLIATPLLGADGSVYVVAQGPISISEFFPASNDVKTKNLSVETSGYIPHGGIVEKEIPFEFTQLDHIKLSLYLYDFNTSVLVMNSINDNIPGNTARVLDAGTIEITVPNDRKDNMIEFLAEIEHLPIEPDYKAKVVINQSTGTIVIGDKVEIKPVAIAQGNLMVNVGNLNYNNLNPLMPAENQDLINSFVDSRRGGAVSELNQAANLKDLVHGLNQLGVWPRDIISILENMRSAGALNAVIEVR